MKKDIRKNENMVRKIVALSLLSAMSIILGKYLAIPWGDILRFSLENMPIFFAGFIFGPLEAVLVATVADLVGCLLVGYTINPLITLGGIVLGLIGSLCFHFGKKLPTLPRIVVSIVLGHLAGSVVIKTIGLSAFYGIGIWELMAWRLFNYILVSLLDGTVLFALFKSPVPDIARGIGRKGK